MSVALKTLLIVVFIAASGAGTWLLLGSEPPSDSRKVEPMPVVVLPLPRDERELQALQDAVNALSDSQARAEAEAQLHRAGDAGLAVLVDSGLYHVVPLTRTISADLLGKWGDQRVLKTLIEAFYAAADPTIPPYQREYVKVLREHVSRLTGQDFFFYVRRTSRGDDVADKLIAWWDANWDKVVPQLGEPKVDATRWDYVAVMKQLRALDLQKRDFPGSNLPPGIASPPEPPRPADEQFRKDFPVAPRETINRDEEKFRKIPTVPKDTDTNRGRQKP